MPRRVCAALIACLAACGHQGEAMLVEQTGVAMGSALRLGIWTTDVPAARTAGAAVLAEFDRLESLMSVWRAGSDVERLNAAAGGEPIAISAEVAEVLQLARSVSDMSDGAFDATFGALSGLWRFDHDQDDRVPAATQVAARLPFIGYRGIELHGTRARLARPGMRVHLGGIGKGYAIDRSVEILRRHGLTDFLLESGGDLYASGRHGDRAWSIGIRDPRGPEDRSFAALTLSNAAISTSGDYERYFVQGDRRYHHILDPRTGEPARGSRSVTIVADRGALADALSTAVFVMGPDAGLALVERLPDVDAVIVTDRNEVRVSPGLRARLAMLAPPGDGM